MKNTKLFVRIAACIACWPGLSPMATAQEVGPTPPADIAKTRDNFPDQHSADVMAMTESLIGMYRGDDHTLYIQQVELPDAAPALYVELVKIGEENHPLRQQLWVPHQRDGKLRIRVSDLPQSMRDMVVGMWAAPQLYPKADLGQYSALGDLLIDAREDHYTGRSRLPMPTAFEGAIEYDLRVENTPGTMLWKDSGDAINGDEIFALDLEMKRRPAIPSAKELDGGVLVYDLRVGFEGPSPVDKDSIVFYFHEWTTSGILIDTTDKPHRGGHVFTIPDDKKALRSWNVGVIGLRKGGIRRIYDPQSHAGFLDGAKTPFRGPRPIISELECISVKDNTP